MGIWLKQYKTNKRIKFFYDTEKDILLIIKSLDPATLHGCENLPIRIIEICNDSITIPLKTIFK